MNEDEQHFGIESSTDHRRVRHPMSDLAETNQVMDEILHRAADPAEASLIAEPDANAIWANYNKGRATPSKASTLTASDQPIDRREIERRMRRR